MKTRLLILLFLTAAWVLNAQESSNKQLLTDDFNTFIRYVEETHPDPYSAYGGRVAFKRQAQEIRAQISESTANEQFRELLMAFIARLGDGHTTLRAEESGMSDQRLPLKLKIAADGLFISGAAKEYAQYIGGKLLSVNHRPVDSLLQKVNLLRPAENLYGTYLELCRLLNDKNGADLLFGDVSDIQLEVRTPKGKQAVNVRYIADPEPVTKKSQVPLTNENNLLYAQMLGKKPEVGYFVWNSMSAREMVEEVALNNRERYLGMNLDAAYSTLGKPRPQNDDEAIQGIPALYETFSGLLETMKTNRSKYLIIDLRKNGGGATPLCRPLLYMLYGDKYLNYECKAEYNRMFSPLLLKKWRLESIEQYNYGNHTDYRLGDFLFGGFFGGADNRTPEEKRKDLGFIAYYGGIGREYTENLNGQAIYSPHVIVLCSPATFSAAYHFMYFLTEIGKATVVGVPSRQAGNTFMETTDFELPHTKIKGSISNAVQLFFPDNPVKGKVFMPDFTMRLSNYAKYNFDENAEILYTLDLIKTGKIKE